MSGLQVAGYREATGEVWSVFCIQRVELQPTRTFAAANTFATPNPEVG